MKARSSCACLVLLAVLAQGCHYLDYNYRAVEDGAFYRSGQMPARRLDQAITKDGIGTVINLRGETPDEDWYAAELAVCDERNVAHHDLDWTKSALPEPDSLAQLLEWYRTETPAILVHCQGGTHRSGIASACYLLEKGEDLETARGQLDIFFNDAPIGQLLDLYEGSTLPFGEWVITEYPSAYEGVAGGDSG